MRVAETEYDAMKKNIADFTCMIVGLAERPDIPNHIKVESILLVEHVFHKLVMSKIIEKCKHGVLPSSN